MIYHESVCFAVRCLMDCEVARCEQGSKQGACSCTLRQRCRKHRVMLAGQRRQHFGPVWKRTTQCTTTLKTRGCAGLFDNVLSDYLWARAVLLVGKPARPAHKSETW